MCTYRLKSQVTTLMLNNMNESMNIEMEQTSIYILLACFAAQLKQNLDQETILHSDEDYHLVAKRHDKHQLTYEIEIWRTAELEDNHGAVFAVSQAPGIIGATHIYIDWNSIPIGTNRSIYGPMWGIAATFSYPDDMYELEALHDRSQDAY